MTTGGRLDLSKCCCNDCPPCCDNAPPQVQVEIAGFIFPPVVDDNNCVECDDLNGTFLLPYDAVQSTDSVCVWELIVLYEGCDEHFCETKYRLEVTQFRILMEIINLGCPADDIDCINQDGCLHGDYGDYVLTIDGDCEDKPFDANCDFESLSIPCRGGNNCDNALPAGLGGGCVTTCILNIA